MSIPASMAAVTRSPRPSPAVFAYCKQSNTGSVNGLGIGGSGGGRLPSRGGLKYGGAKRVCRGCEAGHQYSARSVENFFHAWLSVSGSHLVASPHTFILRYKLHIILHATCRSNFGPTASAGDIKL